MVQLARITKSHIITRALEEKREGSAIHLESLQRPGKEALRVTPNNLYPGVWRKTGV